MAKVRRQTFASRFEVATTICYESFESQCFSASLLSGGKITHDFQVHYNGVHSNITADLVTSCTFTRPAVCGVA
jgi:hypothetical protein